MNRDERGRFVKQKEMCVAEEDAHDEMTQEQLDAICYKSKLLNKYFDSYEELKAEEDAYRKEHDEKLKLAEEKKARAKEIEDLYRHLQEVKREAVKAINDAEKEYIDKRNEFVKDYGSFHMSYFNNGKTEELSVSDFIKGLLGF